MKLRFKARILNYVDGKEPHSKMKWHSILIILSDVETPVVTNKNYAKCEISCLCPIQGHIYTVSYLF